MGRNHSNVITLVNALFKEIYQSFNWYCTVEEAFQIWSLWQRICSYSDSGCNQCFAHKPQCLTRHLNILVSNVCIYYYCVFKSNLCLHSTIEERRYECSICEEPFSHPQCMKVDYQPINVTKVPYIKFYYSVQCILHQHSTAKVIYVKIIFLILWIHTDEKIINVMNGIISILKCVDIV